VREGASVDSAGHRKPSPPPAPPSPPLQATLIVKAWVEVAVGQEACALATAATRTGTQAYWVHWTTPAACPTSMPSLATHHSRRTSLSGPWTLAHANTFSNSSSSSSSDGSISSGGSAGSSSSDRGNTSTSSISSNRSDISSGSSGSAGSSSANGSNVDATAERRGAPCAQFFAPVRVEVWLTGLHDSLSAPVPAPGPAGASTPTLVAFGDGVLAGVLLRTSQSGRAVTTTGVGAGLGPLCLPPTALTVPLRSALGGGARCGTLHGRVGIRHPERAKARLPRHRSSRARMEVGAGGVAPVPAAAVGGAVDGRPAAAGGLGLASPGAAACWFFGGAPAPLLADAPTPGPGEGTAVAGAALPPTPLAAEEPFPASAGLACMQTEAGSPALSPGPFTPVGAASGPGGAVRGDVGQVQAPSTAGDADPSASPEGATAAARAEEAAVVEAAQAALDEPSDYSSPGDSDGSDSSHASSDGDSYSEPDDKEEMERLLLVRVQLARDLPNNSLLCPTCALSKPYTPACNRPVTIVCPAHEPPTPH
jgi:hypothetical protein